MFPGGAAPHRLQGVFTLNRAGGEGKTEGLSERNWCTWLGRGVIRKVSSDSLRMTNKPLVSAGSLWREGWEEAVWSCDLNQSVAAPEHSLIFAPYESMPMYHHGVIPRPTAVRAKDQAFAQRASSLNSCQLFNLKNTVLRFGPLF